LHIVIDKGKEGKIIQLPGAGNYLLFYYNILPHCMQQISQTSRLFAEQLSKKDPE